MSEQTFTVRILKEHSGEPYSPREVLDAIIADPNFRLNGIAILVDEEPCVPALPTEGTDYPKVEINS